MRFTQQVLGDAISMRNTAQAVKFSGNKSPLHSLDTILWSDVAAGRWCTAKAAAAMRKVFAIGELQDLVFELLDIADLCAMKRVDKTFRAQVQGSTAVAKKLFLYPQSAKSKITLVEAWHGYSKKMLLYPRDEAKVLATQPDAEIENYTFAVANPFLFTPYGELQTANHASSVSTALLLEMFLTQPPVEEVCVRPRFRLVARTKKDSVTVTVAGGVKLGHVVEAVKEKFSRYPNRKDVLLSNPLSGITFPGRSVISETRLRSVDEPYFEWRGHDCCDGYTTTASYVIGGHCMRRPVEAKLGDFLSWSA